MKLYEFLNDRAAICVLKELYELEVIKKASYTSKLSEIKNKLNFSEIGLNSINNLIKKGLITSENVNGERIMSITEKGKHFIEIFDQLVELFNPKPIEVVPKKVSIKFELTQLEKKILVIGYKISSEIGRDWVPLKTLTQELYPYEAYERKASQVSRYVARLQELNLAEKKKKGRETLIKITDKGFRTIKEQYLRGLIE